MTMMKMHRCFKSVVELINKLCWVGTWVGEEDEELDHDQGSFNVPCLFCLCCEQ
jgi:hypothetical protein